MTIGNIGTASAPGTGLPEHFEDEICQCTEKMRGFGYNEERNMWVCAKCGNPSSHNTLYVSSCMFCGEWFVLRIYQERVHAVVCANCEQFCG